MKQLCAIPMIFAALASGLHAQNAAAPPPMRDAATHEQLAQQWREAQQNDPTRKIAPAKGPDPSKVNLPLDLLSQSDILCFGGLATLVPKRAVLLIPEGFAERMKFTPGAKIVSWMDFFAANRGWVMSVEITRVQAEGNEPLAEETRKIMTKSGNLVVATYQGGPISLLPPKVPPPPAKSPAPEISTEKPPP